MLLRPARVHRCLQLAGMLNAGLPGPAPLQTKAEQKAKGVTIEEFKYIITRIRSDMAAKLAEPEAVEAWIQATGGTPLDCPPMFSFDNPTVHSDPEALKELGLADKEGNETAIRLKLPTYSGDLHRTIERVHARICGDFEWWLLNDCQEYDMLQYCLKLRDIFFTTQSPAVI